MREALAHLAGLDRAAQPQACRRNAASDASARARWRLVRSLQSCASIPSFSCAGASGAKLVIACRRFDRAPGAATRSPASFSRSRSSRRHSFPPPTAACTIRSRPKAAPSSAAVRALGARQIPRQLGQLSPPAVRAVPGAQQQRGPPVPHRVADPVEPGNRQAGPSGKPERVDSSAGPARFRAGPRDPAAPIQAAAPRGQRPASPRRDPLYRGAASTTNPVRAAARRYRARPSRRVRRQSAAAGRDRRTSPVAMQRRCGDAAVSAAPFAAVAPPQPVPRETPSPLLLRRRGLCLGCRPRRTNGRVRGPP